MIAPAVPSESGNGLAMRLGVFLEGLRRAGQTDLLVLPIAGPADAPLTLATRLDVRVRILELENRRDTVFRLLSRLADPVARLSAFRAYGRPTLASFLSPPVLGDVADLIRRGEYDLVHVGRLYLAEAVPPGNPDQRLTMDVDDDDQCAFRRSAALARREGRHAAAAWALAEADAFARIADKTLPFYDAVFSATGDRAYSAPTELVPNAVPIPHRLASTDDGRTLVFVGSFGYSPNVDAVLWFVRDIWPRIHREAAQLRLYVVGRDPPPAVRALHGRSGVAVLGAVRDLTTVYARAMLAIAPIRSGGGTRIKLIEAASWKVPFVATTVAAEGLSFGNNRCGWIADGAFAFSCAVLEAARHPEQRRARALRAFRLASATHDRRRVTASLAKRFQFILKKSSGADSREGPTR